MSRTDTPLPEFEALAELAAAAAVFARGLRTYTNAYPTAYQRLTEKLDVVYPRWREGSREDTSTAR